MEYMVAITLLRMRESSELKVEREGELRQFECFRVVGEIAAMSTKFVELWKQWWEMADRGLAITAVQLASVFICDDRSTLLFTSRWTSTRPSMYLPRTICRKWEGRNWLSENVAFMKAAISVQYLDEHLIRARGVLPEESETIEKVRRILDEEPWRAMSRIDQLFCEISTMERISDGKWWI